MCGLTLLIRTRMGEWRILEAVIKERRVWVNKGGEVKLWLTAAGTINQPARLTALNMISRFTLPPKKPIQSCLVSSFVFISTSGRFRPNGPPDHYHQLTSSPLLHPMPSPIDQKVVSTRAYVSYHSVH